MRIYLTDYRTASTETTKPLTDIKYPQSVHVFEDTYARAKSGLVYPPHKVAEKVLDPVLCKSLRERPGKTAFILAGGNAHFAGINNKKSDSRLSYDFKFLPVTLTQVFAGRIGHLLKADDHIAADASACASSLKTMMDVLAYCDGNRSLLDIAELIGAPISEM